MLEIPTEGVLTPDDPLSPEEPRSPARTVSFQKRPDLPEVAQGPVLAPLKISVKDIENAKLGRRLLRHHEDGLSDEEGEESSADFFVDALTTMGSDADSEPGSRGRWDTDSAQSRFAQEGDHITSPNHSVLKAHVEAHRSTSPGGSPVDHDHDFARRLGLQEHSPVAAIDTIEWESEVGEGESPHAQLSVEEEPRCSLDESVDAIESVASVGEDPQNDRTIVRYEDVHENSPPAKMPGELPDKVPNELPDKVPNELPDKVPNELPDKVPAGEAPDKASEMVPAKVSNKVSNKVSGKIPAKVSDKVLVKFPEKPTYQFHESISLLDSYRMSARVKEQGASVEATSQTPPVLMNDKPPEAEDNQLTLANVNVKQTAEQNVEQVVTTPKSRRQWQKANGAQLANSILSGKSNGGSELSNILRARMLESSGHSSDEDLPAIAPHGEDSGRQLTYRSSSSNASSPYTNISSSDVAEADGYTSSANSSPKGANFGALLSPSESPPRIGRGLMGSPANAHPPFARSPNLAPPITPFLSSSPSVSRCPSINNPPVRSRLLSHHVPSPQRDITLRNAQISVGPAAGLASDSDKVLHNPPLRYNRCVTGYKLLIYLIDEIENFRLLQLVA